MLPIVAAWRAVAEGRVGSTGGRIRSFPGGAVHRRRRCARAGAFIGGMANPAILTVDDDPAVPGGRP